MEMGKLSPLTGAHGIESFRWIFARTRFPTTLGRLRKFLGWKLFDIAPRKQAPVDTILKKIPPGSFQSVEELVEAAKNYIG